MNNLKPFNLEKAKAGAEVITRDGYKVRILCFDRKSRKNYNILGLIEGLDNDNDLVAFWGNDGRYSDVEKNCKYDLFMKPNEITYYYCIYLNRDNNPVISNHYKDKQKLIDTYAPTTKILEVREFTVSL